MYVAPGLLDRRIGFYTRSDDGADGFQRPLYTKTGVYWGRIDATANAFTVAGAPQGHTDSRTTLMATVADYVPVDPFGVVKEEGASVIYSAKCGAGAPVDVQAVDVGGSGPDGLCRVHRVRS